MVLTRHRSALSIYDKTVLFHRQMKWLLKPRRGHRHIARSIRILEYADLNLELIFTFRGLWKRFINETFGKIREFREEIKTGDVTVREPKKVIILNKIFKSYTKHHDDIRMAVLVTLNRELPPDLSRHIAETYI